MRLFLFLLLSLSVSTLTGINRVKEGREYTFHGQINGKYPITLIFREYAEGHLEGLYYYTKIETPIALKGNATDSGYLLRTTSPEFNEIFTLKIFHAELLGTWASPTKTHNVELWRNTNPTTFLYISREIKSEELGVKGDWPTGSIHLEVPFPSGVDADQMLRIHSFNTINNLQLGYENSSAFRLQEEIEPRTIHGSTEQIKHMMNRFVDTFCARYIRESKRELIRSKGDINSLHNETFHRRIYRVFDSEKFKVFQESSYTFSGGAHGLYSTSHLTIDKAKKAWANISDYLSTEDIEKKLPELLNNCYRDAHGIDRSESLKKHSFWIDRFTGLGGNVYFTDRGLHTTFGLYEIAPYSEGEITIFVPFSLLQD